MRRTSKMIFCLAMMSVAHLAASGIFPISSLAATSKTSDPLDIAVAKLIDGAFRLTPCVANTRISIGLWAFDEEKVPVGAATARRLHQELELASCNFDKGLKHAA
jgi:hypothetical protein